MDRPVRARVLPIPDELTKAREQTRAANVAATLAHHPPLSRRIVALSRTILNDCTTPRRQRELVILRTGWKCQSHYEFGQHTLFGRDAGVTDSEIVALTRPLDAHPWSADDLVLLRMADELHADCCVSDETWEQLTARWPVDHILEFVVAALGYFVVSGLLNTFGVELDEGVPGWPQA